MVARDRTFFSQGINQYVPKMQMSPGLRLGVPVAFSLGTPAAASANNLATATAANAAAGTIVTYSSPFQMDGRYGRTVRLTPSGDPGAVGGTIDIFGDDYLGQPMVERFSGANAVTSILYGRKAFYRVRGSKIVTPSTNAVTWAVGTGFRLGLPYKGDIEWAKEGGILIPLDKRDVLYSRTWDAADSVAGKSKFVRPPFPGFVLNLITTPDAGGSTNDPVVVVKLATVAIIGLTTTVDTSDTTGLTVTDTPTTVGYNANNRFLANGLIEINSAAAASAFGFNASLTLTPTQFSLPDQTDPATSLTGDPRGTYESRVVFDGATDITVGLLGDPAYNASNNGGLHGIRHVAVA